MTRKEYLENNPMIAGQERCWRCNQIIGDDAYEVNEDGIVSHWWGQRAERCIELALPTIHLNGTHRKDLYAQYQTALEAIRNAEQAVANAAPHMRDYYVLRAGGADEFRQAEVEHRARIQALERVRAELEKLLAYVATADGPGRLQGNALHPV